MKRSFVIDYLFGHLRGQNIPIVYTYFDYKDQSNQMAIKVLFSLLKQLVLCLKEIPQELQSVYHEYSREKKSLDLSTLIEIFLSCSTQVSSVFILLDAFDESVIHQQESI